MRIYLAWFCFFIKYVYSNHVKINNSTQELHVKDTLPCIFQQRVVVKDAYANCDSNVLNNGIHVNDHDAFIPVRKNDDHNVCIPVHKNDDHVACIPVSKNDDHDACIPVRKTAVSWERITYYDDKHPCPYCHQRCCHSCCDDHGCWHHDCCWPECWHDCGDHGWHEDDCCDHDWHCGDCCHHHCGDHHHCCHHGCCCCHHGGCGEWDGCGHHEHCHHCSCDHCCHQGCCCCYEPHCDGYVHTDIDVEHSMSHHPRNNCFCGCCNEIDEISNHCYSPSVIKHTVDHCTNIGNHGDHNCCCCYSHDNSAPYCVHDLDP